MTVLFCDVTGSTELGEQLDPEALRALLARYFERMKAIVERHGGSVEKFIGDAVMAVFGVPVVHEDDALRAVRAAVEMRDAFPELGVHGRIGVTTGEVVTGTEERLATGDAVNVAARLEQAAQPGEILIGESTLRLTRDAVDVEAVAPLALKGKAEPVPPSAWSRCAARKALPGSRPPMVGRETELAACATPSTRRSRTARASCSRSSGRPASASRAWRPSSSRSLDALVVRGRCLPYGEGITYWPVVEVVKQLPAVELDPAAAQAIRAAPRRRAAGHLQRGDRLGVPQAARGGRRRAAAVCVFDDVHWGEETFLDLVEHVADLSRDAPILLLCMARPELLDRRPGWAGGKVNATSVLLEPLGADETDLMIDEPRRSSTTACATRIREAAEGNPLFVEEMVALVQESGDGDVTVPPTIQALLAARLDQLDPAERGVLERGSVEGRVFHRGAVQALAPEELQTVARLTSLVRKELVRPDKAQFSGEDAFRFRHLLIRDAAYEALPKAMRAELHERFAGWLEGHGGGSRRARRDPRLPPRAGLRVPRASSGTTDERGAGARGARGRAPGGGGPRTPSCAATCERPFACSSARRALRPPDDPQRLRLLPSLRPSIGRGGRMEARRRRCCRRPLEAGEPGVAGPDAASHMRTSACTPIRRAAMRR